MGHMQLDGPELPFLVTGGSIVNELLAFARYMRISVETVRANFHGGKF